MFDLIETCCNECRAHAWTNRPSTAQLYELDSVYFSELISDQCGSLTTACMVGSTHAYSWSRAFQLSMPALHKYITIARSRSSDPQTPSGCWLSIAVCDSAAHLGQGAQVSSVLGKGSFKSHGSNTVKRRCTIKLHTS